MLKVLLECRAKKDRYDKFMELIQDLSAVALHQAGYVTGETLVKADDPLHVLVISTWVSEQHWEAWLNNQNCVELSALVDGLVDGDTEVTLYGVPPGSAHERLGSAGENKGRRCSRMSVVADRLLDLAERHAEDIAKRWLRAVKVNPRTPSYHAIPEEKLLPQGASFYRNLKRMYLSEKPYRDVWLYFTKFAEDRHAEGVPLREAIYALIMLRRHLWLYAEFQALFMSAMEMHQAVDSINRVILIFDYGMYILVEKSNEFTRREVAAELLQEQLIY